MCELNWGVDLVDDNGEVLYEDVEIRELHFKSPKDLTSLKPSAITIETEKKNVTPKG